MCIRDRSTLDLYYSLCYIVEAVLPSPYVIAWRDVCCYGNKLVSSPLNTGDTDEDLKVPWITDLDLFHVHYGSPIVGYRNAPMGNTPMSGSPVQGYQTDSGSMQEVVNVILEFRTVLEPVSVIIDIEASISLNVSINEFILGQRERAFVFRMVNSPSLRLFSENFCPTFSSFSYEPSSLVSVPES